MALYQPTYTDRHGRRRRVKTWWTVHAVRGINYREALGTRDKRTAALIEQELIRKRELAAAGVIDPFQEHLERDVAEHLDAFEAAGFRKGRDTDSTHRIEVTKAVFDYFRWAEEHAKASERGPLASLDPVLVSRWVDELLARGLSHRSVNKKLGALRQFSRWARRTRRLNWDPIESVRLLHAETDRRLVRRALTPDEVRRLLAGVPEYRRIAYLLALTAALRRSEIASLTWADVVLGEEPTLTVAPARAKGRRKQETLPLLPQVAARLQRWRDAPDWRDASGRPQAHRQRTNVEWNAEERVLPVVPGVDTLRADLEAAGIDPGRGVGQVDFHALRGTCGTLLQALGVPAVIVQRILRHSDIRLTTNTYAHIAAPDLVQAVAQLKQVLGEGVSAPAAPDSEVKAPVKATGGDRRKSSKSR